LNRAIERAKKTTSETFPTFYMGLYLLDIICASNPFPRLNWNWNIAKTPIHVHCQAMWENKYKRNYAQLCDFFIAPLYRLIFCRECPWQSREAMKLLRSIDNWYLQEQAMWENKYNRNYSQLCDFFIAPLCRLIFCRECPWLSREAMKLLKSIGNWYLQEDYTYLRIYGVTAPPHLLPKYVPNRIILGEIAYQTILQVFNASLAKDSRKRTFISFNMYNGHYGLMNSKQARQEAKAMLEYKFP
jgi:hypothetical protein